MTRIVVLGLLVFLMPIAPRPATASPILATLEGCVTSIAEGEATWTSLDYYQFVAFWDPLAGCDTTITSQGIFHRFEDVYRDGHRGLYAEVVPALLPSCGRVQFDAQEYIETERGFLPLGQLKTLVWNSEIDCNGRVSEPAVLLLAGVAAAVAAGWRRRRANKS